MEITILDAEEDTHQSRACGKRLRGRGKKVRCPDCNSTDVSAL
jgi:hypothetical protein